MSAACASGDPGSCSRASWAACDLDYLRAALPVLAWSLFAVVTIAFVVHTRLWEEFRVKIDDLHDIPAQGIVVARQKHVVLGRAIADPRRVLIMLSMWAELPGFSYLPLQLLYYERYGVFAFASTPLMQVYKVGLLTGIFALIGLSAVARRGPLTVLRAKVLLPCLCDALYLVYTSAILDVLACAAPFDEVRLGGATCACRDRVWPVAAAGAGLFGAFYLTTLVYKLRLSDEVFATQFRYQTSFSSLMTMTRTASCLGFTTVALLLPPGESKPAINYVAGGVNLCIMAGLLRYNYRFQPCLGSGLFPNNLRALSFLTSCWVSLTLVGVTLAAPIVDARALLTAAAVLYPGAALWLWRVNSRRARYFHIPNLPLHESLRHSNYRVRTVAVVSIVLEDHTKWPAPELLRVVELLAGCLRVPAVVEDGRLVAYTCQALWHICSTHCVVAKPLDDTPPFVPRGLWLSHLPVSQRRSSLYNPHRLQDLVQRNATRSSASSSVVPRLSSTISPQLAATRLDDAALSPVLQQALAKAVLVFDSPFPKARGVVAKTLQEMYVDGAVRLALPTYLHVVCTLCSHYSTDVAACAAVSLGHVVSQVPPREWVPLLCDRHKLAHVAALLTAHINVATALLRDTLVNLVLKRVMERIVALATERDPATFWSAVFVGHLSAGWRRWQADHAMSLALEDVFLAMQRASATYHATTRRTAPLVRAQSAGTHLGGPTPAVLVRQATATKSPRKLTLQRAGRLVATAHRSFGSLRTASPLRSRSLQGKLSLQRVVGAFRQSSVVPPAILKDITTRRDLRQRLMARLSVLLAEGFGQKLLPQVLSPSARLALSELVALVQAHQRLQSHIEYVLAPPEARYVRFLQSWETLRQRASPFFTDASLLAGRHRVAPEVVAVLLTDRHRHLPPVLTDQR
ncbi:hypothetical protein ACHHYP_02072 [Achlya hypogyna]|uniref:Uncharacterized protein n=1 Tax=Achlya hypogyna TaxID=1202772 RepID=A0A1V9ZSI0_ACHHY|nr:hypothetical protein ACHHYP_02072 [Achlya hypogyna]